MIKSNPTKTGILKMLTQAGHDIVSSGKLGKDLGISRQAVWKAVEALREEGMDIESLPHRGYRLKTVSGNDLSPSWLEILLQNCPWGHPVLHWEELPSTQDVIKQLARNDAPEGVLCLAEEQVSGRGRLGRQWVSPPRGGIYMSILIRPRMAPTRVQLLNLAAGLAVRQALKDLLGVETQLKWPNDLLFEEKKICGILSETASEADRVHFAVTGIGLNANIAPGQFPAEITKRATSLAILLGRNVHRGEVVAAIVRGLYGRIRALEKIDGADELVAEYRRHCHTLGRDVRVITDSGDVEGVAQDIDSSGALIVATGKGLITFGAADIIHLRGRS